jgi:expansin (peptidoglycan-binding protein)
MMKWRYRHTTYATRHLTDEGSAGSVEIDYHSTDQLPVTAEDAICAMEPLPLKTGGKRRLAPAPLAVDGPNPTTTGHQRCLASSVMQHPR